MIWRQAHAPGVEYLGQIYGLVASQSKTCDANRANFIDHGQEDPCLIEWTHSPLCLQCPIGAPPCSGQTSACPLMSASFSMSRSALLHEDRWSTGQLAGLYSASRVLPPRNGSQCLSAALPSRPPQTRAYLSQILRCSGGSVTWRASACRSSRG
jgi:hypothetical protein